MLLADRGYYADWLREALVDKGIAPCISSRKMRMVRIPHDAKLYKRRHKFENSFARLKDWRRVVTRYDRCPKVLLSACALAAIVAFWLSVLSLVTSDLCLHLFTFDKLIASTNIGMLK